MPPFIQVRPDGVCLAVKVQPRASRNEIGESIGNELKIKVTAPPVDSAANEAVIKLLADTLGCSRGAVRIIRGQASRHKLILIQDIPAEELARKLKVPSA